jgi:hypothetical protein
MPPPDLDALATEVVLYVKSALAPLQARQEALQASIAAWEARWSDVGLLRERLAVAETKAALLPAPVEVSASPAVDLSPVLARLAVAEGQVAAVGELRDRLVAMEAKSLQPATPDPAVADLRDRVTEIHAAVKSLEPHASEIPAVRERLAVLETRAPVPGPAGANGADGLHGKDGADGLGFEDLDVSLDGDRTLIFRFARGDKEKTFRVVTPWPKYQKRWIQGKAYVPGDVVTWDGHLWDCQEATTDAQPDISPKVWLQSVTRGRSGKDGKDGKDWAPAPVVSVGPKRS